MNASFATSPLAPVAPSNAQVWTGRVLTGLIVLLLLVDAGAKLVPLAPVVEATQQLGFSVDVIRPIGFVLAASAILHVIRRTELLGALLVTAYLGGATATHVHAQTSFWCPVLMGTLLWIAYGLRSSQLRSFVLSSGAPSRTRSWKSDVDAR